MTTRHLLAFAIASIIVCNVASAAPIRKISQQTGIPVSVLKEAHRSHFSIDWDEGRKVATISGGDVNHFGSVFMRREDKTLELVWYSDTGTIDLLATHTHTGPSFRDFQRAELVLAGKVVCVIDDQISQVLGNRNRFVHDHQRIETARERIDAETVKAIAETDWRDIAVRFHGPDGYEDVSLQKQAEGRFAIFAAVVGGAN